VSDDPARNPDEAEKASGDTSGSPAPSGGMKRKATLQPRNSSVPPPPDPLPEIDHEPTATPLIVPHPKVGKLTTKSSTAESDLDEVTADYDLDDAPTVDYDPRARGVYERPSISDAPTAIITKATEEPMIETAAALDGPPPVPPSAPPAPIPTPPPPADAVLAAARLTPVPSKDDDAPAAEGPASPRKRGKRRTSRRTVKIPDDPIVRAKPEAPKLTAPKLIASESESDAPKPDAAESDAPKPDGAEPDAPKPDAAEPDAPKLATSPLAETISKEGPLEQVEAPPAARLADLADDVDSEAVTIIRPMRIVEVHGASTPPPDVLVAKSAAAPALSGPPPPTGVNTSTPPTPGGGVAVSTPPAKPPPPASSKASPKPPPVKEGEEGDHSEEIGDEIIISSATLTQEDIDAIEEIEPDRMSLTPDEPVLRKPPPPPPSNKRAVKQREREHNQAEKPAGERTPTQPPAAERKRQKPWWEELFGDDYLRTFDRLSAKHISREVDFVENSLGVEKGAVILDLACGAGQHAVELASRGYNVVGYDLSLAMLARAADEAQERQQKLNFLQGDMREMAFEEMFDGVYCWATSFGYFDEERNLSVLQRIHRALRQGGMLLLDVINRDYVAPRSPSLVWFEGDGCVCMDDMHVDFFTSRLRVKRTVMFDDGRSRELDYSIRLYALHELGKLLHDSGFKVVEVTGHLAHVGVFFGSESPRMTVLAERS